MLYIELDPKEILYKQIYQQLAEHIRQKHLVEGSKLPGIRSLADELGVSVNTVNQAYQQLLVEGYIYSQPRSGYYVKSIDNLLVLPQNEEIVAEEEEKDYTYNFSISGVDERHFPYDDWRRVFRRTIKKDAGILNYTPPKGLLELREAIARYLKSARGIKVDPQRIIVSTGISQLIALLENILPGNPVFALENPGYMVGKTAYLHSCSRHIAINHLHYDSEEHSVTYAVDVDALPEKISVVLLTPSHQFPFGAVMPIDARVEILNWAAQKKNRYIIEDDYDFEFQYKSSKIASLKSLDSSDRVIYMSGFSKSITPALRISFMILPQDLLENYEAHFSSECPVSGFVQRALCEFIEDGSFERHINRMRTLYSKKHTLLLETLSDFDVDVFNYHSGTSLVIRVKKPVDETKLKALQQAGININSVAEFCQKESPEALAMRNFFIIGYAGATAEDLTRGLTLFYEIITDS